MKAFFAIAASLFAVSTSYAADLQIEGLYGSTAATITESLLTAAQTNSSIIIDTTTYTVTKVSSSDETSSVTCSRFHFGGTPAQYQCVLSQK